MSSGHGWTRVSVRSINTETPFNVSDEDSDEDDDPLEPFAYKVLSMDQIVELQRDIIADVTNVLDLSPQVSRTLLTLFRWDKERLFEKYFESSPQEFFQHVHVLNPFEEKRDINPSLYKTVCEICYSSDQQLNGLGCGHIYCVGCWKMYLANKTCSESLSHTITCPAPNCDILVNYVTFLELADDPKVVERYKQLITIFFVECNTLMRWCPSPNCTHAIRASNVERKAVKCTCGHQFCFGCGEYWHEPIACSWLRNWLNITITDWETFKWMDMNAKRCPQCGVAIQKDGGCNRIVCTKRCLYEFCWVCLEKWHGSRYCEISAKRLSDMNATETKVRYGQYSRSYMKHLQSLKREHKLYAKIQTKMEKNEADVSWFMAQLLREAIDALCQCRSTLMYSYVFAFYLKNNNQKVIFECNQKVLEVAADKISETVELDDIYLEDNRKRLVELSKYCRQRRLILVNHVREGNKK